ncbi:MAG: glycoside hydrolase N-terminal domain-containing protein, partial [Clostridiales Family XIII bacterium]|nr:glycoside hydrolase N-terminal domain-containing protein [Clostridiales Family XIII bacterium]
MSKKLSHKLFSVLLAIVLAFSGLIYVSPTTALADAPAPGSQPPLKSWYTTPATNWETQALPLGNGYMGAMVFGAPERDQIMINEKTLWSGGPGANPAYNGGFSARTVEQNVADLQFAREGLQTAANNITPAVKNPVTGAVTASTYSVPADIRNAINRLKGQKNNFGSYQQLSDIYLGPVGAGIPDIVSTSIDKESGSAGENHEKLFDGNNGTKYYGGAGGANNAVPYTIDWEYASAFPTRAYSITSGNDMPGRDPSSWVLSASNDGETYTVIDSREGAHTTFTARSTEYTFNLAAPATYKYFRLYVSATNANNPLQMAEIRIKLDAPAAPGFTNYRRELDIDNSISTVSYTQEGVSYKREYFTSYPGNFTAVRYTADKPASISRQVSLSSVQGYKTISAELADGGAAGLITLTGWVSDHNKAGAATDFSNTLHFAQQVKVVPNGGTISVSGSNVVVEGADSLMLITATGTNYQQSMDAEYDYFDDTDPLPDVAARTSAAAAKSFDELFEVHKADYKGLFDRVKLNLMNVQFPENKTTTQLLQGYELSNTAEEDRYLETLYYQFGRYLLISSSRPGTLPANLQGIWAAGVAPPWSADYHTNINVQMNYWPAEQTNLSETHEPMIKFVQSLVPRGREAAKRTFGNEVRGWTIWHENNIWGNAAPATSDAFFSPEDGAWVAQHIWEHYQFTKDRAFLEENYDLLLESALFWVDTLWTDTRDGSLVANPSYSPEHGPYSPGATEAQAVIWGIFDQALGAAEALGKTDPELQEIAAAKARLWGGGATDPAITGADGRDYSYRIGLGGQFQEWKDEINIDLTGDGGHRHTNHLFPLHPGNQIVAGRSAQEDAYVAAMKVTLNTRGDGATGWSKGWKINFWARLRDGDRAQKLVKEILTPLNRGGSTLDNLFDTHTPFQIDGNFGGTAGITEMLIQSQGGPIELMAAIPGKWNTGAVKGLKARGNVEVDMAWAESHLSSATLKSIVGGDMVVKYPNISTATVTDGTGAPVAAEILDSDSIKIAAVAGASYNIAGVTEDVTPVNPYETVPAVSADIIDGGLSRGSAALEGTRAGDYALFKNVVFGDAGAREVAIEASSLETTLAGSGSVEFRLDSPTADPIASIRVRNTGALTNYESLYSQIPAAVTGAHNLYVTFTGTVNLRSFVFSETTTDGAPISISVAGLVTGRIPEAGQAGYQFSAFVDRGVAFESDSQLVEWSLGGDTSGVKIDSSGLLSVKAGSPMQNILVIATSTEDPSVSGSLNVQLLDGQINSRSFRGIDR